MEIRQKADILLSAHEGGKEHFYSSG